MTLTAKNSTRTLGIAALAVLVALGWGSGASAAVHNMVASLDGSQEVPPSPSPYTGSGTFMVDDVANTVTYHVEFNGLLCAETGAHIHCCAPPGMNAGVIIPLPAGNPKDGVAGTTAANIAGILAEKSYVNIHSSCYPGGEIRGQIVKAPVPTENSTWGRIKALYR